MKDKRERVALALGVCLDRCGVQFPRCDPAPLVGRLHSRTVRARGVLTD